MRKLLSSALTLTILSVGCGGLTTNTDNKMSQGERLFRANCRGCHVLPKQTAKTSDQWPDFISNHVDSDDISLETRDLIVKYLLHQN